MYTGTEFERKSSHNWQNKLLHIRGRVGLDKTLGPWVGIHIVFDSNI